jgi:hypothetical protein
MLPNMNEYEPVRIGAIMRDGRRPCMFEGCPNGPPGSHVLLNYRFTGIMYMPVITRKVNPSIPDWIIGDQRTPPMFEPDAMMPSPLVRELGYN